MSEGIQNNALESEIAELSRQIEEKRSQLEAGQGFVPEQKDVLREVVGEKIHGTPAPTPQSDDTGDSPTSTPSPTPVQTDGSHYLDNLDDENVSKINELIENVSTKGIKDSIAKAKDESPFLLDAFHDALTDKLYEELQKSGQIK